MSNYNTYPNIGIDFKIKIIQDALNSHLGFVNVDFFGRIQKSLGKDGKTFIPEFFTDFPTKKEVYYDDKKAPGGNVFFINSDTDKEIGGGIFQAKVKIVFMLNLDKLYQGKTYRADSEVQLHCVKLVKKLGALSGDLTIERGIENVLRGFDISGIKLKDMQPFHTFSINGNLNYKLGNCHSAISLPYSNGTSELPNENTGCSTPVVNQFTQFQFGERSIQKGVTTYLQIEATNNPTEYSLYIPFVTDAQGITVDENGLITINYDGVAEVILLNYSAINACGRTDKAIYLRPVDNNVNELLPPINLVADDFNPSGMPGSFMLTSTFLAYSGTLSAVEYYIDGIIHKNFYGSLLNNFLGFNGNRMDGLVKGNTYEVKIRVKNTLGQYSEFSEILTVEIPL